MKPVGGLLRALNGLEAALEHADAQAGQGLELADERHEHGAVAPMRVPDGDALETEAMELLHLRADEGGEAARRERERAGPVGVFVALADRDRRGDEHGDAVRDRGDGAR